MGNYNKISIMNTLNTSSSRKTTLKVTAAMIGPGKKWEHYALNNNGKPIRHKMHVRTGDTVVVIAGEDKGVVEKVISVYQKSGRIKVQGVNILTKHVKATSEGQTGKINKVEGVIHQSNVMHWSSSKQVRSRIGHKMDESKNKKTRFIIKTGEVLE